MRNKLPPLPSGDRICIICEGQEEYEYLNKLKDLGVWSDHYEFSFVNAEGNGNIAAIYQDRYQSDSFDKVLVFCDTDKKPYEQYEEIKQKIDDVHGADASSHVILYSNPLRDADTAATLE